MCTNCESVPMVEANDSCEQCAVILQHLVPARKQPVASYKSPLTSFSWPHRARVSIGEDHSMDHRVSPSSHIPSECGGGRALGSLGLLNMALVHGLNAPYDQMLTFQIRSVSRLDV